MDGPEQPRLLDLRGLRCPLPALKTKRALRFAGPGRRLLVLSDDPLSLVDIPNAVRETGDAVLSAGREGDAATFLVMKR
ncbi:MAG TPA: sulfurtransferase TusA family protein [Hansschlegelia sp.]